jgi:Tol biopolymer transport system component
MNADGTGVRPLNDDTHGQFYGVWSPDGGEIAYNDHDPSPDAWYVAVVDVASGVSHRLATGTFPRWSPDGRWIAYADTLPGQGTVNPSSGKESSRRLGVFIIDSSGSGAPRLIAELFPAGSFAWRPWACRGWHDAGRRRSTTAAAAHHLPDHGSRMTDARRCGAGSRIPAANGRAYDVVDR